MWVRIAFDIEKLTWELEFFVKYFIEGYRGIALTLPERAALQEEWAAIVGELAAEPRVSATAIQTVCSKGYDGFAIALVTAGTSE